MPLAIFPRDTFQDAAGNILAGASVEIRRESDNGLAELFSDRAGTVPTANPTATDAEGRITVYLAGGPYRTVATLGAVSVTRNHVAVGTMAEHDYTPTPTYEAWSLIEAPTPPAAPGQIFLPINNAQLGPNHSAWVGKVPYVLVPMGTEGQDPQPVTWKPLGTWGFETASYRSGAYTLTPYDAGRLVVMSNSSAGSVTVPAGILPASRIAIGEGAHASMIFQVLCIGSGDVTLIAGSGVTFASTIGTSPVALAKHRVLRFRYIRTGVGTAAVYPEGAMGAGGGAETAETLPFDPDATGLPSLTGPAIIALNDKIDASVGLTLAYERPTSGSGQSLQLTATAHAGIYIDGGTLKVRSDTLILGDEPTDPFELILPSEPPAGLPIPLFRSSLQTGEVVIRGGKRDLTQSGTPSGTDGVISGLTSTEWMQPGDAVSGDGVPGGSVILSVDSSTQITIDQTTTASDETPITVEVFRARWGAGSAAPVEYLAPYAAADEPGVWFGIKCDAPEAESPWAPSQWSPSHGALVIGAHLGLEPSVALVSGEIHVNTALGSAGSTTLNNNADVIITGGVAGFRREYHWTTVQDGTGGHTLIFESDINFIGGDPPTFAGAPGAITRWVISIDKDGKKYVGIAGDDWKVSA